MNTLALFIAPWDLAERGSRDLLLWARDQGINTIFLATLYHAGWLLHPHHRRKAYMVEDGCCYYHPDLREFEHTRLKPVVARLAQNRDWVAEARDETNKLGMKLVLWTVCLHNSRLGLAHPELTCSNAYGDSYPHALCPSHPEVREYVRALVRDQTRRCAPDGFLLEATGHHRGRTHGSSVGGIAGHHHERDGLPMPALEQHLLNLSFAASDRAAASEAGVDVARLQRTVHDHLEAFFETAPRRPADLPDTRKSFEDAFADLARYEAALSEQCNELVRQVKSQPIVEQVELIGDVLRPAFDALLLGCYNKPASAVAPAIADARQKLVQEAGDKRLIVGVRLGFNPPPHTAAINSQTQACEIARTIADCRADGLAFYFYGEAPQSSLNWIKPAIQTVRGQRPGTQRSPQRMINIGLIGAGGIGEVHLRALGKVPGARLRAIADCNPAKSRRLAEQLQVTQVTSDARCLIDDGQIDLLVIATPPNAHAALAQAALKAGKHLLLEKPMGRSLAECDAICQAAARTDRTVGVALVHRYDGARFAARELIRCGAIGRVLKASYRWGRGMYDDPRFDGRGTTDRKWLVDVSVAGGGILPSSTIHVLSTLTFLFDEQRVAAVWGDVRQLHPRGFPGIEDDVDLVLRFSNGAAVTVYESWVTDRDYEMCIEGERGRLKLAGPSFNEIGLTGVCNGAPVPSSLRPFVQGGELCCRPHELDDSVPPYFDGLATDMVAACREEHPRALPGLLHARNVRAIIAAALESARTGARQPVEWSDELARGEIPQRGAVQQELAR